MKHYKINDCRSLMAWFSSSDKRHEMISENQYWSESLWALNKMKWLLRTAKKIQLVPTVMWYSVRSSVMTILKQSRHQVVLTMWYDIFKMFLQQQKAHA